MLPIRFFLLFVLHLSIQSLGAGKSSGYDAFKDGESLLEAEDYQQAGVRFWAAVVSHDQSTDYSVADAFQMFLISYQMQGKLAAGYAFVAASMHRTGDNRKLDFLKMAYRQDPLDPDVVQVMKLMGETSVSLEQSRRYKEEEVEMVGQSERECQASYSDESHDDGVESGWNDEAIQIYHNARLDTEHAIITTVHIPPVPKFSATAHWFWRKVDSWEPNTFEVFSNYITEETIAIDFGAWIGPTLFYHSQLSKKSYAMEADPAAYAQLERNLELNPHLRNKIHISPVAVSTYKDAGILVMSSGDPGNSMSEIGDMRSGQAKFSWTVRGYPLPALLDKWAIDIYTEPVFIKIDIESYECAILPSFYEWLVEAPPRHLTIFVSFHPQVEHCTRTQMQQILKLMLLFDKVTCGAKQREMYLKKETTFGQFEQVLNDMDCMTNKGNSDFVLEWKRSQMHDLAMLMNLDL